MDPTLPSDPTFRASKLSDGRYRALIAAAIALAVGLMALAITRTNTDDQTPVSVSARPDIVEHLVPLNGAQVQRQSELGIDLAPGYEAALIVDGKAIPTDQLRLVPEQNQVFFTPGEGKVIEAFEGGQVCVTAMVWQTAVGRGERDRPFQWCFSVS